MKEIKMAKNFVKTYGLEQFKWFLREAVKNTSSSKLGERLGVTRQRIHQWRSAFTNTKIEVKSAIMKYLADM